MARQRAGKTVDFEIRAARFRYQDRAARYALSQIAPEAAEASGGEGIIDAQAALIRAWRSRVRKLVKAGWQHPAEPGNWPYVYNCPPVGVVTNQGRLRACKRAAICPFCWCRRHVHETFKRAEFFYYSSGPDPRPNALQEIIWTGEYEVADCDASWLYSEEINPNRRFLIDEIGAEGAFRMFSVTPPDPRDEAPYWRNEVRILAVMPVGGFVPFQEDAQTSVRVHRLVDREVLVAAVGRVCSYPRQLFYGPVTATAELANFFDNFGRGTDRGMRTSRGGSVAKGFRMTSTFGALRCGQALKQSRKR